MPATLVPTTTSTINGVTWPAADGQAADVVNENYFVNGEHVGLLVANTGGTPYNLTFRTPTTVGTGLSVEDPVKAMAAGARQLFGPFPREVYGDNVQFLGANAALKFIVVQIA